MIIIGFAKAIRKNDEVAVVKTFSQLLDLIKRLRRERYYGSIEISLKDGKVTHAEKRESIKVIDGE